MGWPSPADGFYAGDYGRCYGSHTRHEYTEFAVGGLDCVAGPLLTPRVKDRFL